MACSKTLIFRPVYVGSEASMKFAIIIPTHNRPEMLNEAIASVVQQQDIEISKIEAIIIDDASSPPVDIQILRSRFPVKLSLHRNDTPCGLTYNRDKGVQLATADVVLHLDDDDKLAPDAIVSIARFFDEHPTNESVFLGVVGFGKSEQHFERVQRLGLTKVIERCKPTQAGESILLFDHPLLPALLKAVPMCFQRIAIKKELWIKTNNLRLQAYQKSTAAEERDKSMRELTGPLRDTEWAIYHSLLTTPALLNKAIYQQRCDGQGLVSVTAMRDKQVQAQIAIKQQLVKACEYLPELQPFKQQIKRNMADTLFNEAYYQLHTLNHRAQAFKYWIKVQFAGKQPMYSKFVFSLCLPHALLSNK